MLEGDYVVEEISEADLTCLNPIVVDGVEYLLLDESISHLGFVKMKHFAS